MRSLKKFRLLFLISVYSNKGLNKMTHKTTPKMILFDVGGTLFADGKFSALDGLSALRKASLNPEATNDGTLLSLWDEFENKVKAFLPSSFELPLSATLKYVIHNSRLKFNMTLPELEELFDRENSPRQVIDFVPELLCTLKKLGIRTAVISNNAMSSEGLTLALNRWLPDNDFEFVLTSADFVFPKPHSELFLSAASSAGLNPSQCMYCGDAFIADIKGSLDAGMSAVLLAKSSDTEIESCTDDTRREYLRVNSWNALRSYLLQLFE